MTGRFAARDAVAAAGLLSIAIGIGLIYIPAAFIFVGLLVTVLAVVAERVRA